MGDMGWRVGVEFTGTWKTLSVVNSVKVTAHGVEGWGGGLRWWVGWGVKG